jgi:hypothetical protein
MTEQKYWAEFEDPARCSLCREAINEDDRKNGLLLHIKVSPVWAMHPDTGEKLGMVQPDGPKNRYLHAKCAEKHVRATLLCDKCGYWRAQTRGGGLCLCTCHPPKNSGQCIFFDSDLERAGG